MRELFSRNFVKVSALDRGMIKFEWIDCSVSYSEWEEFREDYFSESLIDYYDKLYILNDCRKQDLLSMELLDTLVGRAQELVSKKEGRELYFAFLTGNNQGKIEEFENIKNLLNNSSIFIENFDNENNALNWLYKNKSQQK